MLSASLGRYQILERLGRGGMGEIYLAEDPALGRKVAIKVLPAEFRSDADRRNRLIHEARAASALNHPNIVVIFDIGESEGSLFIAMELIEGQTLREWVRDNRPEPRRIVTIARQIAAALAVAHEAGLVHRDLKPENLMVRRDGLVKILDFGLARSGTLEVDDRSATRAGTATPTLAGAVIGTVPYMSPEQVLGQPAGPASDLFSLGTILYEFLTGRHPFAADAAVDTMHRILHEAPEPVSRVNHALTSDFDFVIAKMLAKDPNRRHASARDLDVDLETLECGCGPASTEATAAAGNVSHLKSVAVLPFKNIGGDPALHYLGMGFADAVITRLSASPDLVVRATGAVARFQDQAVDPRLVGQELHADVVLDASFQRAGDRLRATARLVDAPSGRALWADKVDVRFDDIFEVQDQVAKGIAEALTARLTRAPSGTRAPAMRFVPSPQAYQHFMRGMEAHRRASEQGLLQAIDEFEAAVRLQPDYGQAWAYLGFSYHGLVDGGVRHEPVWYEKAAAALARARSLDPEDGQVRHLAAAQHIVHGRKREAYAELAAAVRCAPHFWANIHYVGYLFRLCDQLEAAIPIEKHAIELEPNLPWAYGGLIRCLRMLGRIDEERTWIERFVQRTGQTAWAQQWTAADLAYEGRFREVLEGFETGRFQLAPSRSSELILALAHRAVGDPEKARAHMANFEPMASIDMDAAADAAAYYAHAGDAERGFHYLDRAVELGNDMLTYYRNSNLFGPLQSNARWKPFIAGVEERVARFREEFRWPLPA